MSPGATSAVTHPQRAPEKHFNTCTTMDPALTHTFTHLYTDGLLGPISQTFSLSGTHTSTHTSQTQATVQTAMYKHSKTNVCVQAAGRQVFHRKLPHCTQSLKLPGSTLHPISPACPHLLLDTFQKVPITQNAPHPANLELTCCGPLLRCPGNTLPLFNGSLQSRAKHNKVMIQGTAHNQGAT